MLSSLSRRGVRSVVGGLTRRQLAQQHAKPGPSSRLSAAQAASQRVESHSYDELQQRRGRPISPHVTNYRFPIAAISSITNRITGVALVGGLYGIGALSLVGVDAQHIMSVIHDSILAGPVKLVVTFPLIYHYFAAARHTIWDFYPETVENKSVEKSSLLIFAAAGSLSLAAACLG